MMVQGTSGNQLLEQSVQQDETIEQKQQQSQILMGQGVLLEFFEPSSQRLPYCLQETIEDDHEDEAPRLSQCKEVVSNQRQQQHPVETILYSNFKSNGQQST